MNFLFWIKLKTLRIDIETFSSADLKKCGVYAYADAKDFEILLFGYAYDDDECEVVDIASGETLPKAVFSDLTNPHVIKTAFNAQFEIVCINAHFTIKLDPAQWRCTAVHALYLGLPNSLAEVGRVIGFTANQQKGNGWPLINFFCMPCSPTKGNGGRTRNIPTHAPMKWQELKDYCKRDVEAERFIAKRISRFEFPSNEQKLWVLDQQMNTFGISIDRDFVDAAISMGIQIKDKQIKQAIELTGLNNPNSRNQLLLWLQQAEQEVTDLTKKTIPKIIKTTTNGVVKEVLELRQSLSKTSTSKYDAMRRAVCSDGRIRGLMRFYGANRTGRYASQIVQIQNLPQNKLKDLDAARQLVKACDMPTIEMLFGSVQETLSQLIRTAFTGPFVVADFNSIEARVIAWLAKCQWRMDVFNTHGRIYESSAEQMFGLPTGSVDKKSPFRQRGKVAELALGYGGGVNALKTMGALENGLTEDELEPIKNAWRSANKEIVKLWYAVETAAKLALIERTTQSLDHGIEFVYESGFLFIKLPSGRRLAYVKPNIESEDLVRDNFTVARAGSITYEGVDPKTKQWGRVGTYGGKLVENITQAIARDCLCEAMLALDSAGYQQVMTIHDEIVIEAATGLDQVIEIMARPISWSPGLPLKADGFVTPYYCKEIE